MVVWAAKEPDLGTVGGGSVIADVRTCCSQNSALASTAVRGSLVGDVTRSSAVLNFSVKRVFGYSSRRDGTLPTIILTCCPYNSRVGCRVVAPQRSTFTQTNVLLLYNSNVRYASKSRLSSTGRPLLFFSVPIPCTAETPQASKHPILSQERQVSLPKHSKHNYN